MADIAHEPGADEELLSGGTGRPRALKRWQRYVDADLGFRNHWYPIGYADDIKEEGFFATTVLGENVLASRVDGDVRVVRDRCSHRGVRFSVDPLCFQRGTVSCWYHGWTYDTATGQLCDVLTSPGSPVIGKVAIDTYPVEEAQGVVFVFVGDIDPPPLAEDVPPGFLDDNTYCLGIRRTVDANWRMGAENGFDTTHIFMHRNSVLQGANNIVLPLGLVPQSRQAMVTHNEQWPKGVLDKLAENYIPVFEATVRGDAAAKVDLTDANKMVAGEVSIWLPGTLKVDPFPDPSLIQYEFYVPIDAGRHDYFQVLQRAVANDEDIDAFRTEFRDKWDPVALRGFNDDDIWAREAMEEFYGDGSGWANERLFPPDMCIVEWRRLAAKHARGVQTPATATKVEVTQ